MSPYRNLIEKEVEVVYRYGKAELFSCGVLLDCTDNHVVLEQHSDQFGKVGRFTLKIPRTWILRLEENHRTPTTVAEPPIPARIVKSE